MKITVNDNQEMQLEEVFNPITLQTEGNEKLSIQMRDSGFEFCYQGQWYFAKEGHVEPFHKSARGNYMVEQKHREESVCCNGPINN